MIVCVCKNVSSSRVREALQTNGNIRYVLEATGACTCCGKCSSTIRELVEAHAECACAEKPSESI